MEGQLLHGAAPLIVSNVIRTTGARDPGTQKDRVVCVERKGPRISCVCVMLAVAIEFRGKLLRNALASCSIYFMPSCLRSR